MDKLRKPMQADELDMDVMAEAELKRLQRQFRIMEGDRNAYTEESGIKLAKQRRVINTLTKEKNGLMNDYKIAIRDTNKRKDETNVAKINFLLDGEEDVIDKIKLIKAQIREMDYQINKVDKQLKQLRIRQVTEEQRIEIIQIGRNHTKTLENKLENVVKRFCVTLSENKKLRKEIDHLLIERSRFNKQWKKLISNINFGKRLMLELIEQATVAYDQREEWCTKFQALKNRALTDLMLHNQEIKELQRQLNIDENLQEFLGVKSRIRVLKDLEEKEALKCEEERLRQEKQLLEYQDTLQNIKDLMEEQDADKLEAMFVKQEEENFALFNYVNELNHEMETLTASIERVKEQIDVETKLKDNREQLQRNKIELLEEQLTIATLEADEMEGKRCKADDDLKKLLNSISELYLLVDEEESPMMHLLDKSQITLYNVDMYLGLIEKNVNELMTKATYTDITN